MTLCLHRLHESPIQLQKLVVVDQLPAKTFSFGPEVILDLKAMRAAWWKIGPIALKPKSRRMDGLCMSIMTVFDHRERETRAGIY
jgi:hypothetical protein